MEWPNFYLYEDQIKECEKTEASMSSSSSSSSSLHQEMERKKYFLIISHLMVCNVYIKYYKTTHSTHTTQHNTHTQKPHKERSFEFF